MKKGTVSVEDLVEFLGVSAMTVYRDIAALEEAGMLQRHYGKVTARASGLHEASARFRMEQGREFKREIAACVAAMIPPGSSVMLDDSTSGVWVIRALEDIVTMSIVTNSLLVSEEAERAGTGHLIIVGGAYQGWAESLVGPLAVKMIGEMHASYAMVSASGIADGNCYHPYEEVVAVKRAMLEACDKKILLLDHTKFSRMALFRFADMTEFDHVVVDRHTPDDVLRDLSERGVNVVLAPGLDA